MIATDGDVGAIWVGFLGANLTDDLHVGDIAMAIQWDVMVLDELECVGALHAFLLIGFLGRGGQVCPCRMRPRFF